MTQKLVLFDIDGTIMTGGGSGKRAMDRALLEIFGTAGSSNSYSFGGKTDRQIVLDLIGKTGVPAETILEKMGVVFDLYIEALKEEVLLDARRRLLPGVRELLGLLYERGDAVLGLLTGNIERGAKIKLTSFELHSYFVVGAYGDDAISRNDLPEIAVERARRLTNKLFQEKNIVIIGDTPLDIECGLKVNAKSIAVATGTFSPAQLKPYQPDYLFENLEKSEEVLNAIFDS